MTDFTFYTNESGDWTVLVNNRDGEILYKGHDQPSSLVCEILGYIGSTYEVVELSDRQIEEIY